MSRRGGWRSVLGGVVFVSVIFFSATLFAEINANVAFGSRFTIDKSDAGVSGFGKKPFVYLEGGSLGAKIKKLKVLTRVYPADAVECLFNVKVAAGTYTLSFSADGSGEKKTLTQYFYVMAPVLVTTTPRWGKPGELVTLAGRYFGTSRPKLWMGYFEPRDNPIPGKFVTLHCALAATKTFMDPETGASSLVFKVPEKMPNVATLIYLQSPSGTNTIAFSNFAFNLQENLETPMRDGVKLSGNLFTPTTTSGPFPTLIFRTPYSKEYRNADPLAQIDSFDEKTVRNAVGRGYAVLMQDVRGRFASEGEYTPYRNEENDGYDTIEWAAAQSWSTGDIGSFGLSYPGVAQWFSAIGTPPHLKAMVPAMAPSTMNQCVYFGGVFEIGWNGWSYKYMSPDIRVRNDIPGPKTVTAASREYYRLGGENAFANYLWTFSMPYLKDTCQFYYDWIVNQPYSGYYDFGDFRPRYPAVKAAVLNLSGWYDEAYGPEGATTNYLGLLAARAQDADKKTKLLIGPWVHGVDATQLSVSGARKFAENARVDYDSVVLDWLDYYVRGVPNGVPDWPAVRVYQMEAPGKGEWISDANWPLTGTRESAIYLVPPPNGEKFGTVSFAQPTANYTAGSFVSNPVFPTRDLTEGTNFGAYNLAYLAETPGVLTFESEKLNADLRVVGQVKAEIYLSADAPDCDLFVKLLDVYPDGTVFNISGPGQEVLRVSYRNRTNARELLSHGEIVKLRFENIRTGNVFKKGHKLRVCLCASWFPLYSRNLQTGELESESGVTRTATIYIHQDLERQSRILLPVIPEKTK